MGTPEQVLFKALAASRRREILDFLLEGEATAGRIVEQFEVTQPAISRDLAALRAAGLVTCREDATRRWYRLNLEPLVAVDAWLAPYRNQWSDGNKADDGKSDGITA